jgi:hypothetical protein
MTKAACVRTSDLYRADGPEREKRLKIIKNNIT